MDENRVDGNRVDENRNRIDENRVDENRVDKNWVDENWVDENQVDEYWVEENWDENRDGRLGRPIGMANWDDQLGQQIRSANRVQSGPMNVSRKTLSHVNQSTT